MPIARNIIDNTKDQETKDKENTLKMRGTQAQATDKPRCRYCIGLRMARTAEYAANNGYNSFTTTLLESKYQPHEYIKLIGTKLAADCGIEFYYEDFRAGWKESIRLSKEFELYRQQYCGCIFSEYERYGPEI